MSFLLLLLLLPAGHQRGVCHPGSSANAAAAAAPSTLPHSCTPVTCHCCCCCLQVTKEEYATLGAARLGAALTQQLQQQGLKPYYIPVGGSSALGCWGYLHAAQEIAEQEKDMGRHFDVLASVSVCYIIGFLLH
jgi:hypothetical protein